MSNLSRRQLLSGGGALATLALLGHSTAGCARARARFSDHPFKLGVASGDPRADGVVLWTRLAPDPLGPDGGMGPDPVTVGWELATDEGMQRVVQKGTAVAAADLAHSVHVELRGLEPARWYWYRFHAGDEVSRVARTRTAPRPDAPPEGLRFAFASCQHWEFGRYAAYHHMLADNLDLVVHLGDYIYETSSKTPPVRRHDLPEAIDLEGYRRRHALYKTDADLQAAHAAHPWIVTWDDHEVSNDYANDRSQRRDDPEAFRRRRAGAYQAYYEHMPLPRSALPHGPDMRLYRDLGWGTLATFFVLDGRQYRAVQACGEGRAGGGQLVTNCPARLDPTRTRLGDAQEQWLLDGLGRTRSRWTILAQQQLMAQLRQRNRAGAEAFWTDAWDGYAGTRQRVLAQIRDRQVPNPVVIGGDSHSFWVTDLKVDFTDAAPAVATEFVGTSISSPGIPYDRVARLLPDNPHVRFFDSRQRGYVRCTVTRERWLTELRALDSPADPRSAIGTLASFVVENGRPGAQRG